MNEKTYTLDRYLEENRLKSDFADLKTKLKNALADGTFLDDREVHLVLTVFSHAAGIEKAFSRLFSELTTKKVDAIDTLHKEGEGKETL